MSKGIVSINRKRKIMYVEQIKLKNFRNYDALEFKPGSGLNILIGKNAQGKTNFLEALNILASSKSFRVRNETELIKWQANYAEIDADLFTERGTKRRLTIRWAYNPFSKVLERRIFIDDNVVKRLSDFLGEVPLTLFIPGDLALIQGGPTLRRRLMDVLLCKVSDIYCTHLINYRHVLRQRNKFLHIHVRGSGSEAYLTETDRSYLQVWNVQLKKLGAEITYYRLIILAYLQVVVGRIYAQLSSDDKCQLNLTYQSRLGKANLLEINQVLAEKAAILEKNCLEKSSSINLSLELEPKFLYKLEELFITALQRNAQSELSFRSTQVGPHRDDFGIEVLGHNLKTFGSQGQHRSAALALRLAEAKIMSLVRCEKSIILLDDCFSELDKGRQEILLNYLGSLGQVFLTAAVSADFSEVFQNIRKVNYFNVELGTIKSIAERC